MLHDLFLELNIIYLGNIWAIDQEMCPLFPRVHKALYSSLVEYKRLEKTTYNLIVLG